MVKPVTVLCVCVCWMKTTPGNPKDWDAVPYLLTGLDRRQSGLVPTLFYSEAMLLWGRQCVAWYCPAGISRDVPELNVLWMAAYVALWDVGSRHCAITGGRGDRAQHCDLTDANVQNSGKSINNKWINKRLVLVTSQQLLDFLGDTMKWTSRTQLSQSVLTLDGSCVKQLKREYLPAIMFMFCPLWR